MRVTSESGYTLVEMLIVIGLLATIAAVATPAFNDNDEAALDLAAMEVARALRFAHSEAIRSGKPYGVIANQSDQSMKVYRLDDSVDPPVVQYDVYDRQTKQLYDLRFNSGLLDVSITQVFFTFSGPLPTQSSLGFSGATGVPTFNDSGTFRMLETGYVRLGLDGMTRSISVSPVTGRVTIQ